MEELAAKEAFSLSTRGLDKPASREAHMRFEPYSRTHQDAGQDRTSRDMTARRSFGVNAEPAQRSDHGDLRNRISLKRDTRAKEVWTRLDQQQEEGIVPRDRERYHTYQRSTRENLRGIRGGSESFNNRGHGDSYSSSSWRVKEISHGNKDRNRDHTRERVHPKERNRQEFSPRTNRSYRSSPDSQRTISEYPRERRGDTPTRRHDHYRRQETRMEWRPIRSVKREEPRHKEIPKTRRDTKEEDRIRNLKGKAIATEETVKDAYIDSNRSSNRVLTIREPTGINIPGDQANRETNENSPKQIPEGVLPLRVHNEEGADMEICKTRKSGDPGSEKETIPEGDDLLTEEEINEMADKYAGIDFDMDESMIDEDDLLEEMENDVVVPETQEITKTLELQNKAPEVGKDKESPKLASGQPHEEADRSQRKKSLKQNQKAPRGRSLVPHGKRRGTRSPEAKGVAASKKLAIRGRASPKGKMVKHNRVNSSRGSGSSALPRNEVYPSSLKGRKLFTASGSVGSQKPPSTQI
ncbi:BnaCnng27180D [Brassica napus]|uniref:BnaCnng27180D protein n=1 Tax=Brassica napus TaxID=3708 RepID=A0A078IYX4_BRANA|nr:BnaCnng27180D [Brassica napus]